MELSSDVFDLGEATPRMKELGRLQDGLRCEGADSAKN